MLQMKGWHKKKLHEVSTQYQFQLLLATWGVTARSTNRNVQPRYIKSSLINFKPLVNKNQSHDTLNISHLF